MEDLLVGQGGEGRMTQDGNKWIEALYKGEFERLYRAAYRMTGSEESARELVQETFALALFHGKELREHPKPGGWLTNTLLHLIRNQRRLQATLEVSLETLFNAPAPEEATVEELLPSKLSEDDRRVLIWRFKQRLDYDEIANRLGISESGCRSRVARAVARCKKLLSADDLYT